MKIVERDQGFFGNGLRKRLSPSGGSAYGMPRNACTLRDSMDVVVEFDVLIVKSERNPRTRPSVVHRTNGSDE